MVSNIHKVRVSVGAPLLDACLLQTSFEVHMRFVGFMLGRSHLEVYNISQNRYHTAVMVPRLQSVTSMIHPHDLIESASKKPS